jgi:peptide methionine sulfoxide reductase MsrB
MCIWGCCCCFRQISHLVTKEDLATVFEPGEYQCAHCHQTLCVSAVVKIGSSYQHIHMLCRYVSASKWVGPCLWPTFRAPEAPGALHRHAVTGYNGYRCDTAEISCGQCRLFLGFVVVLDGLVGTAHTHTRHTHTHTYFVLVWLTRVGRHIFQDGKEQGDTHPDADYRHCVLSLSLAFVPCTPNPTA